MFGTFNCRGLTLTELLLVASLATTVAAVAVPLASHALDEMRTGMAARYVAGRLRHARMDAVKRSAAAGLRFDSVRAEEDPSFGTYVDGNRNGLRTLDIQDGVDFEIAAPERLERKFAGVAFGLLPGVPDVDGGTGGGLSGVRIGASRILSFSPDGTATPGTLYVRGARAQYAVRVLGITGRTRVLQFRRRSGTWIGR